jgi:hypothetical protein
MAAVDLLHEPSIMGASHRGFISSTSMRRRRSWRAFTFASAGAMTFSAILVSNVANPSYRCFQPATLAASRHPLFLLRAARATGVSHADMRRATCLLLRARASPGREALLVVVSLRGAFEQISEPGAAAQSIRAPWGPPGLSEGASLPATARQLR